MAAEPVGSSERSLREIATRRDECTRSQGFAPVPGSTTDSYSPTPEQGIPPTFRGDQKCPLSWLGSEMGSQVGSGQLQLPGGSAQLSSWPSSAKRASVLLLPLLLQQRDDLIHRQLWVLSLQRVQERLLLLDLY